ncbi:HNH endonuclease [Methanobrevibacter cuticularis]|uniref:HNH endonuclease n=1 Tax=Methanobrevibacter cuticularis TaxID=47311 RepID=A0A166FCC0_9EURY|nr:HNH endonuclease signature motif containing protein [Methanobrevibacter cuticularis]KZX17529.1 HNH endonuclease [Methanobrevibacter cuticularis]
MDVKILKNSGEHTIDLGNSIQYGHISNQNPENNSLMNVLTDNNSLLKNNNFLIEKVARKLLIDKELIEKNKTLVNENETLRENNIKFKEKILFLQSEDKKNFWEQMIGLREQNKALKNSYKDVKTRYNKLKNRKKKNPRIQLDKDTKRLVYEKDNFQCSVCGEKDLEKLTVDHINPVSLRGGNDINNLQILCEECNSLKGAAMLTNEEIKMIIDNRKMNQEV